MGLGIQIDEQDPLSNVGQRGAEIDGHRRFAHAALLIHDRDRPHAMISIGEGAELFWSTPA